MFDAVSFYLLCTGKIDKVSMRSAFNEVNNIKVCLSLYSSNIVASGGKNYLQLELSFRFL